MKHKILSSLFAILLTASSLIPTAFAQVTDAITEDATGNYLEAVITTEEIQKIGKSTLFEASQSFIPVAESDPLDESQIRYEWDFGDGNRNQGVEVLHVYQTPGRYMVTLNINDGENVAETQLEVFAYSKLIAFITDQTDAKNWIENLQNYANREGVYIETIDSFGSSTEFISEEVLIKKLREENEILKKAEEILVWTGDNAGLNALSRHLRSSDISFENTTITVLEEDISSSIVPLQRQFSAINPKSIIVAKEAAVYPLIESNDQDSFSTILENGGYEFEIINEETGKLRPWNFMSYFVNLLIRQGIPDNTIGLLILLPLIATIVAFMKQVIGITTFGIYTPSIITLSFLIIGLNAGILTLAAVILIGAASRKILKRVRMLFIPKMALVITVVSLALFGILILTTYIGLFDSAFLSIAIFPMLVLSTMVERFVNVKSEKGLSSAAILMIETVFVSLVAYFIVGGEFHLGITTIKFDSIRNIMIAYPELILLLLVANFALGRWSGLRVLERVRFREILRNIEE